MDETTLKIAAAALCHDIGKFMEWDLLNLPRDYEDKNAQLFLPFNKKIKDFTHKHALLTAAFIESQKNFLPPEFNPESGESWGQGDSLINLAAGHHLPEDSPWRWLIAVADRLAAGWERQGESEGGESVSPQLYRQTRLVPVLACICPETFSDQGYIEQGKQLGLPLAPLRPDTIFPKPLATVTGAAHEVYRDHCRQFLEDLRQLAHRTDNLALWLEHFDCLLLTYTAAIPALRAGEVEASRDVSLYDHLRTTAAVAVALYLYHREHGNLTVSAIKDEDETKFLFVSGDFYGIQDFIFASGAETQRYRAKLLRGRSFAVSLITELVADWLCRELGVPFLAVVLNAAGKFLLLAPNTAAAKDIIGRVKKEVNQWLYEISYGENSFGLSYQEVAPRQLLGGGFKELWRTICQNLEQAKLTRLMPEQFGAIKNYLEQFRNDLPRPLCPLCGRRPSRLASGADPYIKEVGSCCKICRDHVYLGANLVRKHRVAVVRPEAELLDSQNRLLKPLLGRYQVFFPEGQLRALAQEGNLLHLWDISLPGSGTIRDIGRKFLNGYVPVLTQEDLQDPRLAVVAEEEDLELGAPKTLQCLARLALEVVPDSKRFAGVDALGVLKADVDNLGTLIQEGLPPRRFSLARLATLSRQLHFFFCFYLPNLLQQEKEFANIYTIFAGGDDLFLLGPWREVLALARRIPQEFARYVGENPVVHLSAGVILAKAPTPIPELAAESEAALAKAKEGGKNALAIFGEVIPWTLVPALEQTRQRLEDWWAKGWLTKGMLYRINELLAAAGIEKILLEQGRGIYLADLACCKWRSHLAYTVGRNVAPGRKEAERRQASSEVHQALATWLEQYGSRLRLPLWEMLYTKRVRR